jgi:dolichyl-phosphate beta-glucosyltransferase
METIDISVVLPVYNEEKGLLAALEATDRCLAGLGSSYEMVVVNDGSRDGTADVAGQFAAGKDRVRLISYLPNKGKGYAVKTGMLAARGRYRFFFDADLAVPLTTIENFMAVIVQGQADIVIGTRKIKAAVITRHQPFYREILGKGYSHLSNFILGTDYSDFTCGFKCFERSAAEKIFAAQTIERWSFDAEILFLAKRFGCRVVEVPVTWRDNPATKVRLLKDIIRSFYELVRIRVL